MSTSTEAPEVMIASAQYRDGEVYLILESRDKVRVEFKLHHLAIATLLLTLGPAGKLKLAELEKEFPPQAQPSAPDTPEGLEG